MTMGGGVRAGVRDSRGVFLPNATPATGASAPSSPSVPNGFHGGSSSVVSDGFASRIGRPPSACPSPPLDKVAFEARIGTMWGSACVRSQLWMARRGKANAERWGASAPAGGPSSAWWVEGIRSVESQEHWVHAITTADQHSGSGAQLTGAQARPRVLSLLALPH